MDSDVERAKRENEIIAKELEKVEIEATTLEMKKKVDFLTQTSGPSNITSPVMTSNANIGVSATQAATITPGTSANVANLENNKASASQINGSLQRGPVHVESVGKLAMLMYMT